MGVDVVRTSVVVGSVVVRATVVGAVVISGAAVAVGKPIAKAKPVFTSEVIGLTNHEEVVHQLWYKLLLLLTRNFAQKGKEVVAVCILPGGASD